MFSKNVLQRPHFYCGSNLQNSGEKKTLYNRIVQSGAGEIRTPGLMLAKHLFYQLNYRPGKFYNSVT